MPRAKRISSMQYSVSSIQSWWWWWWIAAAAALFVSTALARQPAHAPRTEWTLAIVLLAPAAIALVGPPGPALAPPRRIAAEAGLVAGVAGLGSWLAAVVWLQTSGHDAVDSMRWRGNALGSTGHV